MRKIKIDNLLKSSSLLLIATCISLFMLIIFFSYSLYEGTIKGTHSAETVTCTDGMSSQGCQEYRNSGWTCVEKSRSTSSVTYTCTCNGRVLSDGTGCDSGGSGSTDNNKCYKCTLGNGIIQYTWSSTAVSGCSAQTGTEFNSKSNCEAHHSLRLDPDSANGGRLKSGNSTEVFSFYASASKSTLDAKVTNSRGDCTVDYWIVTTDGNRHIVSNVDYNEQGDTLKAHWNCVNKCYRCTLANGDVSYTWSPSAASGCSVDTSITTESSCLASRAPKDACYVCGNSQSGSYKWIKAGGLTSSCSKASGDFTTESACLANNKKCYKCKLANGTIQYTWSPSAMSGCSAQESITSESACLNNNSCTVTLDANGGSFSNGCSSSYTYTGTVSFNSTLNKCVTKSGQCITGWKVTKGSNAGETYYSNIDQTDCGKTIQAQWGSCSSPTPSNSSVNPSSSSSKSSSSSSSKSSSSSSSNSSSSSLVDAPYDDIIDGNMCYKGEIIEVIACQSDSISGAKCKTSKGILLKSNLTSADRCNGSGGSSSGRQDAPENPKTGATMIIVLWIVGLAALFVSFFYFRKNNLV